MNSQVDEEFIREALEEANLNVLRIALYQQTQNPELAEMEVEVYSRKGSPLELTVLSKKHHERVKELSFEYLSQTSHEQRLPPTLDEAKALMALFEGEKPSDASAHYAYEDLGFEAFSRKATWQHQPDVKKLKNFSVVIVGAGFSGIVAAIQLKGLGINFRIIERQADFGGTWQLNDYPEARVDISSFLYQFKFVHNYPWKNYFSPREELKEYINHVVEEYGLRSFSTFNTEITEAHWNASTSKWCMLAQCPDGTVEEINCNVVFSASGLFSTPKLPDIDGIEKFSGAMFHTTQWDHEFDYSGKKVALIGTGSTGSQLLRNLALKASDVSVYQRTPNWVMHVPIYRNAVSEKLRWLLDNMPYYVNWYGYSMHTAQVRQQPIQELDPEWQAQGGMVNKKNDQMREQLKHMIDKMAGDHKDLIPKLTPDFAPLSRRIVVDNEWYKSLQRDNVELVTDSIESISETGIVTKDGTEREYDLIVLAAGFQTERYLHPVDYVGRDGVCLNDLWSKDGARAHLTMSLPSYPNFFMFYGPNAAARAGSFHSWLEIFTRYACNVVTEMIERDASTFELRKEVYEDYNNRMDQRAKGMLWEQENGGGGSYYINEHGRSTNTMPWRFDEFYQWTKTPNFDDFTFGS